MHADRNSPGGMSASHEEGTAPDAHQLLHLPDALGFLLLLGAVDGRFLILGFRCLLLAQSLIGLEVCLTSCAFGLLS